MRPSDTVTLIDYAVYNYIMNDVIRRKNMGYQDSVREVEILEAKIDAMNFTSDADDSDIMSFLLDNGYGPGEAGQEKADWAFDIAMNILRNK